MKVVGVIVEFNPLHTGHLYFLNQVKKLSQADLIIALMSGSFTMRGELSLFDKFEKTRQALQAGVDLVIEFPFCYAVQNADRFAKYAIEFLSLAQIDELWFGSEENSVFKYEEAYKLWENEDCQKKIRNLLDQGFSYKSATASVLHLESNDLLGFCYYREIKKNHRKIEIHTLQRIGTKYDDSLPKEYASSKAIRKNLRLIPSYCPTYVNSQKIFSEDLLYPFLKYRIQTSTPEELRQIFFVEEGLEYKLQKETADSLSQWISSISSKRYTHSRIQRMLCYLLFYITKEQMKEISAEQPNYLRILGYNDLGKNHLKRLKKSCVLYTNLQDGMTPSLDIELKITKTLDLIYHKNLFSEEQKGPIHQKKEIL